MKKCKSCQEEIDDKAKKCPKCQADQRIWFARHPIWTVVIALFLIGAVMSAVNGGATTSNSNSNNNQSTTPTQESQTQEAMKIDVKTLGDAFEANQVAAEKEWGGKLVEFSAEVSNITDSGISFQKVTSKEFSLTQISCQIENKDQLLSIQNGQTITVRGTVGDQTIGVIELKKCNVIK